MKMTFLNWSFWRSGSLWFLSALFANLIGRSTQCRSSQLWGTDCRSAAPWRIGREIHPLSSVAFSGDSHLLSAPLSFILKCPIFSFLASFRYFQSLQWSLVTISLSSCLMLPCNSATTLLLPTSCSSLAQRLSSFTANQPATWVSQCTRGNRGRRTEQELLKVVCSRPLLPSRFLTCCFCLS